MTKIYNEIWISLVLWSWNWLGITCEIEDGDKEERHFWWKKIPFKNLYFRFWVYKLEVIWPTEKWLKIRTRNKIALKIIFWFCN